MNNLKELIIWLESVMINLNSDIPAAQALINMKESKNVVMNNHCFNALEAYQSKAGIFERFLQQTTNTALKKRGQELLFMKAIFELQLQKIDDAYTTLQLLREISDHDFFFHLANINIGQLLYTHYRYVLDHDKRREEIKMLIKSIDYKHERTNTILNTYKKELEEESKRINSIFYSFKYQWKQYRHFG